MKQARLYLYAPSGALLHKTEFARAQKRLTQLGLAVELDEGCLSRYQRFAGTDEERIAAIHRAAKSGSDFAMITRGGYGLTRILDGLDYELIAQAIEQGTQFIGLSDFTAFQSAVLAKTGKITWAGPTAVHYFGVGGMSEPDKNGKRTRLKPDEITEACFMDVVEGVSEGCGWYQTSKSLAFHHCPNILDIEHATLWGGNLTVLTSLIGTPYCPQIKNGILFLEDVGEHPYRIERMLTQLGEAGILMQQKAILLGYFTNFKLTQSDGGFNLAEVFKFISAKYGVPMIANLPMGHTPTMVMLPVGKAVNLHVEGRDAFLLWGHLHHSHHHH